MKKKITESQLRKMISESVKKVLKENTNFGEKEYINVESYRQGVEGLLYDVLKEMEGGEKYEWLIDDGEYVDDLVSSMNRSMCKYLHMKDHNMSGNFKNLEYDWEGTVGDHDSRGVSLAQVTEMLDAGVDNETTREFKDFAVDWIWEAFGSFGIKYEFENLVADLMYEDEKENEDGSLNENKIRKALRESVKKVLKEGQSDGNLIEKWNYWCANFDHDFIQQAWAQDRMMAKHLEEKFNECYKIAGTYGAMTKFYLELDGRNRRVLENYIINNY